MTIQPLLKFWDPVPKLTKYLKIFQLSLCKISTNVSNKILLTSRSQTLTSPDRQPDAKISLDVGWNAIHQGVLRWPSNFFTCFPVFTSDTYIWWSPCVEATLEL